MLRSEVAMLRPLFVSGLLCASLAPACLAQNAQMPPDYRGVTEWVGGIFVTPVPGAPFTATVNIVSKKILPDGESGVQTTLEHIARDSSGRIYNERRAMVAAPLQGDPMLLSGHIYDPATRLSTFLNPFTHLARQQTIEPRTPAAGAPPNQSSPALGRHDGGQLTTVTDLGEQTIGSTQLQGTRKVWTVPANVSGTGKVITITDEYWFSPTLSVYLILKHEDPRTGEQIVAVQNVSEKEPDASQFQVPARFRVIDENPAP